ncbi:hypothetical protein PRUPE_1G531200 [Prunus persica]|uniref:Uncharacterized protein n=1 Tax=Prunus persica TaxID=3760 RepID=M5Y0A4_PRUPE|nr:hypothetical protein PRUPE_1G531200 [Prunus persica]
MRTYVKLFAGCMHGWLAGCMVTQIKTSSKIPLASTLDLIAICFESCYLWFASFLVSGWLNLCRPYMPNVLEKYPGSNAFCTLVI